MIRSYYIYVNGCEVLLAEVCSIRNKLNKLGLCEANIPDNADIVLVIGCSFTQAHENQFDEKIRKVCSSSNDNQTIIVSGCYLRTINDDRLVYSRKDEIIEVVTKLLDLSAGTNSKCCKNSTICPLPFVIISEGCYGLCSFCSIRLIRGEHRSRDKYSIVKEAKEAFKVHGYIKLVGQDVAVYGRDRNSSLPDLFRYLCNEIPDIRIGFGSLDPGWLSRYSSKDLSLFAEERIWGNIHLAIQSKSDSVLKCMRRGYTSKDISILLQKLKKLRIQNLSVDLISGFPNENEPDHFQNIQLLRENAFKFAQLFAFEERPGTDAASLEQVPRKVRLRRTLELIATFAASYSRENRWGSFETEDILNTNIQLSKEEVFLHEG